MSIKITIPIIIYRGKYLNGSCFIILNLISYEMEISLFLFYSFVLCSSDQPPEDDFATAMASPM